MKNFQFKNIQSNSNPIIFFQFTLLTRDASDVNKKQSN